ncbi:hypothetical protein [Nocardia bhagyanarayanae]|uniref:hypothetical protein n=1 Tax=Nocardia bhagyanarayanae TaxID=1215925 RepID=UPI0011531D46|nr:hypothetical protein [Nocardia bhagyanarayanae]
MDYYNALYRGYPQPRETDYSFGELDILNWRAHLWEINLADKDLSARAVGQGVPENLLIDIDRRATTCDVDREWIPDGEPSPELRTREAAYDLIAADAWQLATMAAVEADHHYLARDLPVPLRDQFEENMNLVRERAVVAASAAALDIEDLAAMIPRTPADLLQVVDLTVNTYTITELQERFRVLAWPGIAVHARRDITEWASHTSHVVSDASDTLFPSVQHLRAAAAAALGEDPSGQAVPGADLGIGRDGLDPEPAAEHGVGQSTPQAGYSVE